MIGLNKLFDKEFIQLKQLYVQKVDYENKQIEIIYRNLFSINYLSTRLELKKYFDSVYFRLMKSCLIEAFQLSLNGYYKGASYVYRSSIENYFKYSLLVAGNGEIELNDRVFTVNKKKFTELVEDNYPEEFKRKVVSNISKLEKIYKGASGLSHSLTEDNQKSIISYFSDIGKNMSLKKKVFLDLEIITTCISRDIIPILIESYKKWDSDELDELFSFMYANKEKDRYLKIIK